MSGTGKSALVEELRRRGHHAYDADDHGYTEPRSDGRWGWRPTGSPISSPSTPGTCSSSPAAQRSRSTCPSTTASYSPPLENILINRLRRRTTNTYGANAEELAQILDDLAEIEPLLLCLRRPRRHHD
jgi:hypothetical protein